MANFNFNIGFKTPDGSLETFALQVNENGVVESNRQKTLTLSATYDESASRYFIMLILDNEKKLPNTSQSGFSSITDMMQWLNNNWYIYGSWYWIFGQNKILLHVSTGIATSGSLAIESVTNMLVAAIPAYILDDFYQVIFTDNNSQRIQPWDDQILTMKGDILAYVQNNYSQCGKWSIDGDNLILVGIVDLTGFGLTIGQTTSTSAFTTAFSLGFEG